MRTVTAVFLVAVFGLCVVPAVRVLLHHRKVMRILKDADRAIENMEKAKDRNQLIAMNDRVNEILEHAEAVIERKE